MGYPGFFIGRNAVITKVKGKVYSEQMYKNGKSILSRISPDCELCNKSEYYTVSTSVKMSWFYIPLGGYDRAYKITCSNCGDTIELEYDEYLALEPLIRVNNKYEKGKITKVELSERVREILSRAKII